MTRILIGYDGSAQAVAALDDLRLAGLGRDVEARILSVGELETLPPNHTQLAVGDYRGAPVLAYLEARRSATHLEARSEAEAAKRTAQSAAEHLRSEFPDWHVDAVAVGGDAPHELIETADEWNADLLVVGAPRRSALGRLLLGSVSKRVVADADRSVRVARPRVERDDDTPPRILVGVDGSPDAESAVRAVGRRVWPSGTEVRLVAVDDGVSPGRFAHILPTAAAMITEGNRQSAARARDMVAWAADELGLIGLDVSTAFHKGDPRRVLVEEARAWGADSVFVGARSFGGDLERSRIGRVATGVAAEVASSVEVVRSHEPRSGPRERE
jgi:nucleotide-binding universal stress UspA family protein